MRDAALPALFIEAKITNTGLVLEPTRAIREETAELKVDVQEAV